MMMRLRQAEERKRLADVCSSDLAEERKRLAEEISAADDGDDDDKS